MSTERDTERIVRSWLEVGATALPDRVLDAVLDQLPATPQRRSWWPARRFRDMNVYAKFAIAAAAVVVIAIVGINLLPGNASVGGPGPSPTPSPTPVALAADMTLTAGTAYALDNCCFPQELIVTVPAAGWFTIDSWFLGKSDIADPEDLYDMTLLPYPVESLHADPCHWQGSVAPVGPTVDDLATALVAQGGPGTPAPTDVTVGGYSGKRVELAIPETVDTDTCDGGDYGRWLTSEGAYSYGPFTYGKRQHDTVYIVDVDGTRWVIDTNYQPGTTAASLAELDKLVASIRFEPKASTSTSASPATSPAP